jgi:hypothetical protein
MILIAGRVVVVLDDDVVWWREEPLGCAGGIDGLMLLWLWS